MLRQTILEEWAARNPKSAAYSKQAQGSLVDGVTQDVRVERPFPVVISDGEGSEVETLDGDRLVCYVMGHGALMLGHRYPAVVDAIAAQAKRGLHYGGSHQAETQWAQRIVRLMPSVEKVRFTSSGTEATQLAIRIARKVTGREHVLKLNGHFHGWHDSLLPGFTVPFDKAFDGVPNPVANLTTAIEPAPDELEALLRTESFSAVILEPAGGYSGAVPLADDFVRVARDLCDQTRTLLVFDEVVTGFRWAPGGAQEVLGVLPDLTTLGKIMAGGMPGGAVGGPSAMMDSLAVSEGAGKVIHTGTHNAHPVAAAAGIAMLDEIADGTAQERAAETSKQLIDGFNDILEVRGIPGLAYGASSHFCILLGVPPSDRAGDPTSYGSERLRVGIEPAIFDSMNCGMMLQGVHMFHGHGFVSSAHDTGDVETTLGAFEDVVTRMKSEGILTS